MSRSFLRATTALTVSLSLIQPGQLAAQGMVAAAAHKPGLVQPSSGPERLIRVQQTCEQDPTLPECVTPPAATEAEPGTAAPAPEGTPEAVPEVAPEQPAPEAAAPEAPAAEPEAAPPAPEEAPQPEAVTPEPQPEAVAPEPEAPAEPAAEPEAAPVQEPAAEPEAAPAEQPAAEPEAAPVEEPAAEPEAAPAEEPAAEPEAAPVQEPAAEPEAAPAEEPATEPEAAPAEQPAAEPEAAPAEQPAAEQPAAEPEAAPAEQPAAEPEAAPAEQPAAEPEAAPAEQPAAEPEAAPAQEPQATQPEAEAAPAPEDTPPVADPVPEPTPEQAQVLETLMADPEVAAAVDTLSQTIAPPADPAAATQAPAADSALSAFGALESGAQAPDPADTMTQVFGAGDARSSTQDFTTKVVTAPPSQVSNNDDDGLSDLQKAGLVALGAVVVGMLINNNRVVANSGDRVVVDRGNGDLAIWKDDNAILRAPGVVETTQRYNDGSTLTTLERPDGSQIITVRDATGRVLRRDRVDVNGRRVPIIDDTRPYTPVEVSLLPRPRVQELRFTEDTDPDLIRALLEDAEQPALGRSFSLAQVRDIRQVRELAPDLTADPITFASGSSAIRPEEAGKLARLGSLMRDMIADNPRELFLIEGHTDATGGAAMNLALSDRRAESVALALSEIFGVPAENMVVQGYGERYLKVQTQAEEPRNRRVALRRITWLVDGA